jgi:hypothetical protein
MPRETGISKAVRLWLSVGTSVLIGATATACSDQGAESSQDTDLAGEVAAEAASGSGSGSVLAAVGASSSGGEGEGEGASAADPASDDVEYLHRLGQTRGHLVAFSALHRLGAHEMSMTHAKHPESELYVGLAPAFAARGKPGFAAELAALAEAIEENGDIDKAYADVTKSISANEPDADFATRLMAIATLARTAGQEFAIGVAEDGTVVNAHEYQDAYGFLTAARQMLASMDPVDGEQEQSSALADEQLEIALHEFAALTASRVEGNASVIHGAAARIEIAANMLP